MAEKKTRITNVQAAFLLISFMVSARFMILPRALVEITDSPDAWLAALLNFPIAIIAAAIAAILTRTFPRQSFFDYVPNIIGKLAGVILSGVFILYFVFYSANELRIVGELIRFYLLPETPLVLNLLALLMSAVYLTMGGILPVIRIQLLFLPIVMVSLLLVLLIGFEAFDAHNVQPLLANGILPIIRGLPANAVASLGFAIITIFGLYMNQSSGVVTAACWGAGVVAALNSIAVFCAIGVFGEQALQSVLFPVMELVKSVEVPGGFFERIELLFLTVFLMTSFATISIGMFVSALGMQKLLKTQLRRNILILSPVMMLIALIPRDLSQIFAVGRMIELSGIILEGAVPALLLFIVKSKFRRAATGAEESTAKRKSEIA